MIDLSALFFLLLMTAFVCAYFMQPNLDNLFAEIGHRDTSIILLILSAIHWILGISILVYSAWGIHYAEVLQTNNLWETIGVCSYLTFLGHRYATLYTWVKREQKLHEAFRSRFRTATFVRE